MTEIVVSNDYGFLLRDKKAFEKLNKDIQKDVLRAASLAINEIAFLARQSIIKAEHENFTIRNNFIEKQTQYTKAARAKSLADIKSTVGITEKAGFMAMQEEGGTREAKGKALNIPALPARGGGITGIHVRKYRADKLQDIVVRGEAARAYASNKSRVVARAYIAKKTKKLLPLGSNLVEVTRFDNKASGNIFEQRLVLEREHQRAKIKGVHFFLPACEDAAAKVQELFNKHMDGG